MKLTIKIPAKVFLYYSTLLALLIIISATLFNFNIKTLVIQLIFLPVLLFLIYRIISQFRQSKNQMVSADNISTNQLFFAIFFLGVLVIVGSLNVFKKEKKIYTPPAAENQGQPPTTQNPVNQGKTKMQFSADNLSTPKPTPTVTTIRVKAANEKIRVNIRQEPSMSAKIIGKAKPDQTYQSTGKKDDLYEIIVDEGKTGWVHQDFIEIENPE